MVFATADTSQTADPYSRYSSEVSGNDIALIVKILKERKKIIIACVILAIFCALAYFSQIKVTYVATTKVMVTPTNTDIRKNNVLQSLITTGRLTSGDLLSEIQVMRSPGVVKQLIIDQGLYQMRDYGGAPEFNSFDELSDTRKRAVIDAVTSRLAIAPVPGTSIVDISFESNNPIDASQIANAHPDAYARNERQKIKDQAQRASDWLKERLGVLQDDVRKAEMALENAREENNLTLSQNNDVRINQIELLTQELTSAEAQFAETEAILELIDTAKKEGKSIEALPNFLTDRLTENLKFTESGLIRKKAMLAQKYGPNHPEMRALNAEFIAFRAKLNEEIDIFAESLKNQSTIQQIKIREIDGKINEYRESYKNDSEKRLLVRNLQTTANTSRTLLNNFMNSYLQSLQNLNIEQNPVRVIASAGIPKAPATPNKMIILFLSAVTGMFVGVFIALIMERLDDSVQSPEQLENMTGLPVYASLPHVKMAKNQTSPDYLAQNPGSVLAELMRSLYVALTLRDPHQKAGGRVITVTSTYSDEGKTTTALWLAMTAVQTGKKVLIIDADMRRPSLHKAYGISNNRGLADYLSNRLPLDDTIYKNDPNHVHVMTSKAVPTHALTLLSGERMETLIRRVRDDYDLIIIDAPTSHMFSDARVCAKLSDKTLYIAAWKQTKRDDLRHTLKQFTDMNYKNISLVLNKVDEKAILKLCKEDMTYMTRA